MRRPLLSSFLQALRAAGHDIGVRDYEAVLRLLASYDGIDVDELGELLVALLGGDEEGGGRVRRVFAEQKERWPAAPSADELAKIEAEFRAEMLGGAAGAGAGPDGGPGGGTGAGPDAGPGGGAGAGPDAGPGGGAGAGSGRGSGAAAGIGAARAGGPRQPWRGLWGSALVGLLLLLAWTAYQRLQPSGAPDGGGADLAGPRDLSTAAAPPDLGGRPGSALVRCPPPGVSEQRVLWRGGLVGLLMMGLLLALQALPQRRLQQRDARRERARLALQRTKGPKEFPLHLPGRQALFRGALREALDDLAVTLARLGVGPGGELDLKRVLEAIGRSGFVLEAPRQERRSSAALVLLLDQGQETRRYHAQVDALRAGLRARGLVFTEVGLYPRADRVVLSLGLGGMLRDALPQLDEALAHGAVLLVSAGGAHLINYQRGMQAAPWLRALALAPRRGWLHPSADPRCFALPKGLPLRAWPLSGAGLQALQVELRGGHARREPQALRPEQVVGERELETLLRLLAMDPQADEARLEWLRGRHAEAVPAEAVVELWRRYGGEPRGHLKLELAVLQKALSRQREEETAREAPLRERAERWSLLEAYWSSEPAQDSLAHLRWQLAVALQQIQLKGEAGDEELATQAQQKLQELARSTLLPWEEVKDALGLRLVLPPALTPEGRKALVRLQRQSERDELPLPPLPGDEASEIGDGVALGWALEHWAPALLWAGLLAAGLDLGLWLAGPVWLWRGAREPVRDAYELKLVRGERRGDGMLMVSLREVDPAVRPKAARLRLVRCAADGSAVPLIERTQFEALTGAQPLRELSKLPDGVYQVQGDVQEQAGRVWHLSNELLVQAEAEPAPAGDAGMARDLVETQEVGTDRDMTTPAIGGEVKVASPDMAGVDYYRLAWSLSPTVKIPGGRFVRGNDEKKDTKKATVAVESFSLGVTEVTVAAYQACYQARGQGDARAQGCTEPNDAPFCNWNKPGKDNHPINCVDFAQAEGFCRFLGLRLPNETEWEYAARGGAAQLRYPWGNDEPKEQDSRLCSNRWTSKKGTCPVQGPDQRSRNAFQLADMAGNVYEWTTSMDCEDYSSLCRSAKRVARGGSWSFYGPLYFRNAYRGTPFEPVVRVHFLGFRCAGAR